MAKAKVETPTPQITGGRVVFSRSVQPAQYESKKAEVEIIFAVPEGAEVGDFLDKAAAMAQRKALEMVGLKTGPKAAAATADTPPATPAAGSKAALEAAQAEKLGGDKPAKPKVAMPNISSGEERKPPAEEEWGASEATTAEPITDATMKDACSKRNQVLKAPKAIKALIATFVEFPKGCADIPQEKRQEFLTKLEALKAE